MRGVRARHDVWNSLVAGTLAGGLAAGYYQGGCDACYGSLNTHAVACAESHTTPSCQALLPAPGLVWVYALGLECACDASKGAPSPLPHAAVLQLQCLHYVCDPK